MSLPQAGRAILSPLTEVQRVGVVEQAYPLIEQFDGRRGDVRLRNLNVIERRFQSSSRQIP